MTKKSSTLNQIISHFQTIDPVIHSQLIRMDIKVLSLSKSPDQFFLALCREIIGQQLGGKAADAIYAKFVALFKKSPITPKKILSLPETTLRSAGLSGAKVRAIQDLSAKVLSKQLNLNALLALPDDQVIAELIKVKGIGPWTAEMFLIFTLGREDVFSAGDLGLKNGFKKLYGVNDQQLESKLKKIVPTWSPYKSYASLALWRSLDTKLLDPVQ